MILDILGEYERQISEIEMYFYKFKCHVQYTSEASTSISTCEEHSSGHVEDKVKDEESRQQ
jgi:hypothetical protein